MTWFDQVQWAKYPKKNDGTYKRNVLSTVRIFWFSAVWFRVCVCVCLCVCVCAMCIIMLFSAMDRDDLVETINDGVEINL